MTSATGDTRIPTYASKNLEKRKGRPSAARLDQKSEGWSVALATVWAISLAVGPCRVSPGATFPPAVHGGRSLRSRAPLAVHGFSALASCPGGYPVAALLLGGGHGCDLCLGAGCCQAFSADSHFISTREFQSYQQGSNLVEDRGPR